MNQQAHRTEGVKGRHAVFIILLVSSMVGSFCHTAFSTAIPVIMKDFQISVSDAQWLTSAFSLVAGIMLPATAFLIRRFPAKKLFFASMAVFGAGSLVAAMAPSFQVLMVGRILQALNSGIILSLTQVLTLTLYPPEKRGTMMGIYGLSVSVIPIFAPSLSGVIVDLVGWSIIFWVTVALSLIIILVGMKFMSSPLETEKQRFDTFSMALCAAGFGGVIIGLGNLSSNSIILIAAPLAIGCLSLVLFAFRQLRMEKPFLDLRTLKNQEFRLSVIYSMLMYCTMMAGSTLLPVYMQSIQGYSATFSGLIGMPSSIVMAIISPFAGKFYDKLGIRKLLLVGSFLMLISCAGLCFLSINTSAIYISAMFCVRLLAIGLMMMPITTWGMSTMPSDSVANGTALLSSLRTISGAAGSAVFAVIMAAAAAGAGGTVAEAQLYGINFSFTGIAIVGLILFAMALFLARRQHTQAYS